MNVTTGAYDADGNRTDTTLTLNNAPKSLEKAIRPLQTFFRINNIKKSTIGALEEMLKCASINGVGVHELGDHFVLGFHTAAGILNYAKDNDIILETTLKSIIESDAFDSSTKCMSFLHDKISDRIFLFAFRLGCSHHYQNVDGMRGLATHLHKALNMEMSRKDRLKHRVERENLNSQVELKLCDHSSTTITSDVYTPDEVISKYDDSGYGYISSISELTIVSPDVVSSSEAVSCYIPPSSEEEAMEQFSSSPPVSCSWEVRLKELATYKEANGHTNVPQRFPSNKQLGNWVTKQRHQYKLLHENEKSTMTKVRMESLNELDFEWGSRSETSSTVWDVRLQELAAYKEANGHTNVPQRFPSNKPLGLWVKNQRQEYKLYMTTGKSKMTAEHIKSLNKLDFEWSNRTSLCSWEVRLQELAAYKEANGHTNVPQRYSSNEPLGHWVTRQRTQYKLYMTTGKSKMTAEHIKSLNKLDFEWSNRTSLCSWEVRLQELATYKEQNNGSTNVPQRYSSNEPLGHWVTRQRTQYKLLKRGRKSAMTAEHIKSLNELDFEWGIQVSL